jgi:signal transduction histidine kinase
VQRILGVTTDESEHYEHQAELAAAANALAHAELNERRRIGRELHDSTAQLLVAARLGLNRLSVQGELSGEPLRVLDDARQAIESAQREIRNFSFVLHPPALLEAGGLEDSLRTFAVGFGRRTGLEIGLEAGRRSLHLPFRTKVALFRVAQEALMNVYRHAGAASAVVRLKHRRGRVILEIEDDGVGLPGDGQTPPEGVGISGMRARMKQLGGAFELTAGRVGVLVRASVDDGDERPRRRSVKRSAASVAGRAASGEDPIRRQGLA